MANDLIPKLKEIDVDPRRLILDPNNPRLITKDEDRRDSDNAVDLVVETSKRMSGYKIKQVKDSIRENGWLPVDYIFVRKIKNEDRYLVLEGNRRVTAIREIIDETPDDDIARTLSNIQVMEVTDDIPEDQLRRKITYLLGVRHHGALKKWSPFAQARNIYTRYMEVLNATAFRWVEDIGKHVADALSIETREVKARLQVYCTMQQLGDIDSIKNATDSRAGIKDRYYSVCEEVIKNPKKYGDYIAQNSETFTLDDASVDRMVNLCHFDKPARQGSPISNPQEWRKLHDILSDEDIDKREANLARVEVNKEKPSDVWAERSVELQTLQWDHWLNKVHSILKQVTFDDLDADDAPEITSKLSDIIATLENATD